ncbi:MAG: TlpA disulfide reductase family protein [Litorimonas sp.]
MRQIAQAPTLAYRTSRPYLALMIRSVFTLANAIKLMIFGALLVFAATGMRACQAPEGALDRFATGSLGKLVSLDAPPTQPGLTFATPDGEVSLADYRGKIVLVNIWGTWCAPCVAEMPSLDELERLRGGEDFAVVPVALRDTVQEIETFYARYGIEYLPAISDRDMRINPPLRLPGVPTSIFYDEYGRELARLPGEADWASEEALALVDHLTGQ